MIFFVCWRCRKLTIIEFWTFALHSYVLSPIFIPSKRYWKGALPSKAISYKFPDLGTNANIDTTPKCSCTNLMILWGLICPSNAWTVAVFSRRYFFLNIVCVILWSALMAATQRCRHYALCWFQYLLKYSSTTYVQYDIYNYST